LDVTIGQGIKVSVAVLDIPASVAVIVTEVLSETDV